MATRKTGIEVPCRTNGRQNPDYFAAYYDLNRERILERNKRNRSDGRYREQHLCNSDYRGMLVEVLMQRDGDNCGICGEPLRGRISIDHILPRCRGGLSTADNLQLAHLKCNLRKRRDGSGD